MSVDVSAIRYNASVPDDDTGPLKVVKLEPGNRCFCGSQQLYEHCCQSRVLGLRDRVERERQTRDPFRGPPSVKAEWRGKCVRAVYNRLIFRDLTETFHEYIIELLVATLGKQWFNQEDQKPADEQHVVRRWLRHAHSIMEAVAPPDHRPGDWFSAPMSGTTQALLALADDVYRLRQVNRFPKRLKERLRTRDQFQGVRYEVAIAATFVRCGFGIDWTSEKSVKTCEFVASHPSTRDVLAVEVKSRHRPGVLHQPGTAPTADEVRADVERLFADALRQNPGDKAFAVFVDLNLPPTPTPAGGEPPWAPAIEELLRKFAPETGQAAPFTLAGFTNFYWHYEVGFALPPATPALFAPANATHAIQGPTFFALLDSLSRCGVVDPAE